MRILLIEDDERIRSFVKRGLEAEGYNVQIARNGSEGLDLGMSEFNIIILDLLLPDQSGLDVCRQLRESEIRTPILMLTAKDAVQDKVEGFRTGADDYLTKPFAFDELLARIKALLRRGPLLEMQAELKVADLTMNRDTREVRRGTRQIQLTSKEYALLEYLMSHPNRPLSRPLIIEQVWGYNHDTLTNVVDVYIRYLRNKVDRGFRKKLIQTVRDIGYKLVTD